VLIVVDPNGVGPVGISEELQRHAQLAEVRGADKALVFTNIQEDDLIKVLALWRRALAPLECMPQSMGSLTFNVLTTTNLFVALAPKLSFLAVNYWT